MLIIMKNSKYNLKLGLVCLGYLDNFNSENVSVLTAFSQGRNVQLRDVNRFLGCLCDGICFKIRFDHDCNLRPQKCKNNNSIYHLSK